MAELDDVQLRYHVRLEGLSLATLRAIMADITVALDKIEADVAVLTPEDAPLTYGRFQALRSELASVQAALTERLADCVSESLDAVIATSAVLAAAMARSLSAGARCRTRCQPRCCCDQGDPVRRPHLAGMGREAGRGYDGSDRYRTSALTQS